jgi:hypothetical protein
MEPRGARDGPIRVLLTTLCVRRGFPKAAQLRQRKKRPKGMSRRALEQQQQQQQQQDKIKP